MNKKKYDLIIGIPSYNNAKTIAFVVEQLASGLQKYFSDLKVAIANSDGGSIDGTQEVFLNTNTGNIDKIPLSHVVISGKGGAIKRLFELINETSAKAGMMVDADLKSINPEWVKNYLEPVLKEGFDYIAPNYLRDKNDGTITKNLAYPLTTALYGGNLCQPIGGDFAFSAVLARRYLEKPVWETDVARFGIDVFMTTVALCEGYKVGQVYLGAKNHDPKDPRGLGPMFSQVSNVMFQLMKDYQEVWKKGKRAVKAEELGCPEKDSVPAVKVNVNNLIHEFKRGFRRNRQLLGDVLSKDHFDKLDSIQSTPRENFNFSLNLWVRLVYDFGVLYNQSAIPKSEILEAFTILYYGRVASYILEVKNMTVPESEEYTEKIAREFRAEVPYLMKRWLGISDRNLEWFKKNTFHYSDYAHISKLIKLKNQKKLTIGLALPAKNEAATIGPIVESIKKHFIGEGGLIDQFLVIDSNSDDGTIKIVEDQGVKVFQCKEVLKGIAKNDGAWGKGDNLWKSLYLLDTDIICWVDTDIENFDPRFIYGLVGPLLTRQDVGFVKGFYRRPLKVGDVMSSSGGGRVTELTVRPLLNTFYPDLSKIIQPLSGEYAGRREIFESIPFCINYALETCMLIDIYTMFGLEVIGQSDLKVRIHRNQSLKSLSKLSFGIMQAIFNRLHIHGKVRLLHEPVSKDDSYDFNSINILESQLPPIKEIAEYQDKFKNRTLRWHPPER
jgi:glycosyltransferase involved in cell wall biosynthesis